MNFPLSEGGREADGQALPVHNPQREEQTVLLLGFCGTDPSLGCGVALNRVPSPESNKDDPRQSYQMH